MLYFLILIILTFRIAEEISCVLFFGVDGLDKLFGYHLTSYAMCLQSGASNISNSVHCNSKFVKEYLQNISANIKDVVDPDSVMWKVYTRMQTDANLRDCAVDTQRLTDLLFKVLIFELYIPIYTGLEYVRTIVDSNIVKELRVLYDEIQFQHIGIHSASALLEINWYHLKYVYNRQESANEKIDSLSISTNDILYGKSSSSSKYSPFSPGLGVSKRAFGFGESRTASLPIGNEYIDKRSGNVVRGSVALAEYANRMMVSMHALIE
jgi:hypothetical protein